MTNVLHTPYEGNVEGAWDIYPRPMMKRESFISLNGLWELSRLEGRGKQKREEKMGQILVPYPPESRLSGVEKTLEKGQAWVYRKTFEKPVLSLGDHLHLHFGAVDQICRVFINDVPIGSHEGGYLPFSVDITPALREGINEIRLYVEDDHKEEYPLGKQSLKRGGMWYTAHSGIWQSVWMEAVPENAFTAVEVEVDCTQVLIRVEGAKGMKRLTILDKVYAFSGSSIHVKIEDPILWTPETPHLYSFTLENKSDRITSYFAMRTISIEKRLDKEGQEGSYICLNGEPIFLHGLLDQGYYPDGIVLPASPEGYVQDIAMIRAMGFNMLRKHIKIEPQVYYHECDRQGILVMQDLVNSGKYSFLVDSALPTIGFTKGIRHRAARRRQDRFESDAVNTVKYLHVHPCIYGFTIFNEGWGQYDGNKIYRLLKRQEPGFVYDTASGWFDAKETDVVSKHIYFRKIRLKRTKDKPLTLSEYGGYTLPTEGHSMNPDKPWGYRMFRDKKSLQEGLDHLIEDELVPAIHQGLCCAVLTQVSDVEDETNGMVTYDRQVEKVDGDAMKRLADKLQTAFREQFSV